MAQVVIIMIFMVIYCNLISYKILLIFFQKALFSMLLVLVPLCLFNREEIFKYPDPIPMRIPKEVKSHANIRILGNIYHVQNPNLCEEKNMWKYFKI